jgi:alpha-1,4-digalacturonate transport system substrate-binding protein
MRRLAVLAVAVGLLAGCAPGSGADDSADDSGGDKPKNLTFVSFTDGPDLDVQKALIAQFEKEKGAKVELQIVPFSDLDQRLQGRLASGEAPDVMRTDTLTPYRGELLDLPGHGQDIADQFIDEAQDYMRDPDGKVVAVPSDLTMNGPFVNTDAFKKAGVALPTSDDPWTWDELVTNAKAAQKALGSPYAIAIDKSGHRVSTMINQFGTTIYGEDGKVAFDEGKATAALREFVDLTQKNVLSKDFWIESGTKYEGANDIFLAQDAPVYISGNWQVGLLTEQAKFGWQAIPNPCADRCGGFPGGKFMAAFKDSGNPELAAEFVAFMNTKAAQEKFAKEAQFLPTRKDLIDDGVEYPQRAEDMATFLADVKQTGKDAYATNYSPGFSATADEVVKQLGLAIAGKQSVEDTVAAIKKAAQTNVEAAGG